MYALRKVPSTSSSHAWGVLLLFIPCLQFISIALRPYAATGFRLVPWLQDAGAVMQAITLWPSSAHTDGRLSSYNLSVAAFGLGCGLTLLRVALGTAVGIIFSRLQGTVSQAPATILSSYRFLSCLLNGVGFIPVTLWLLAPTVCRAPHGGWPVTDACFEPAHTFALIFGVAMAIVHVAVSCIETLCLVDQVPFSTFRGALFGRTQAVWLILQATVVAVALHGTVWSLVVQLLASAASAVAFALTLPYFSERANVMAVGANIAACWLCLCALLGSTPSVAGGGAMAGVLLTPLVWLSSGYLALHWRVLRAIRTSLKELSSAFAVDVKVRAVLVDFDQHAPQPAAALRIVNELLKGAARQLSSSPSVNMVYAHFLQHYKRNKYLEASQLDAIVRKAPSVDAMFFAFVRRMELQDEDSAGTNMGVVSRIQYDKQHIKAMKSSVHTRQQLLAFWGELADSKSPDVLKVHQLSAALSSSMSQTKDYFEALLGHNSHHVGVLRQYASFMLEVSNEPARALALLEEADSLEDVAARRHASSSGAFSFMQNGTFDVGDEAVAIITASAQVGRLGVVTSCNANALRMFGYSRRELLGRTLSTLMPEPIASIHGRMMNMYLTSGVEHVTSSTRMVFGLHRSNTIFPMYLHVRSMDTGFGALMLPFVCSDGFIMFVRKGFLATAMCERSCTLLQVPIEDVQAGQVAVRTFFPSISMLMRSATAEKSYKKMPTDPHIADDSTVVSAGTRAEDGKGASFHSIAFEVQDSSVPVLARVTRYAFKAASNQPNLYVLQWKHAASAERQSLEDVRAQLSCAPTTSSAPGVAQLADSDSVDGILDDEVHESDGEETAHKSSSDGQRTPSLPGKAMSKAHSTTSRETSSSAVESLRRLVNHSHSTLDPGLAMLRNAFAGIFAVTILVTIISAATIISRLSAFDSTQDLLADSFKQQLLVQRLAFTTQALSWAERGHLTYFPLDSRHHNLSAAVRGPAGGHLAWSLSTAQQSELAGALLSDLQSDADKLDAEAERLFATFKSDSFRMWHGANSEQVAALKRMQSASSIPVIVRQGALISTRQGSLAELLNDLVAAAREVWSAGMSGQEVPSTAAVFIADNKEGPPAEALSTAAKYTADINQNTFDSLYVVMQQVFLVLAALSDVLLLAGVVPLIQRVEAGKDRVVTAFLQVPQEYLQDLRARCKRSLERMLTSVASEADGEDFESDRGSDSESDASENLVHEQLKGEGSIGTTDMSKFKRSRLIEMSADHSKAGRVAKKSRSAFFALLLRFGGPMVLLLLYLMVLFLWTHESLRPVSTAVRDLSMSYKRLLSTYTAGEHIMRIAPLPLWNVAYRDTLNSTLHDAWSEIGEAENLNRELLFGSDVAESSSLEAQGALQSLMMSDGCVDPADIVCSSFADGFVAYNGLRSTLESHLANLKQIATLKAREAFDLTGGNFTTGIDELDQAVSKALLSTPSFLATFSGNTCTQSVGEPFDDTLALYAASTGNRSWLSLPSLNVNVTACTAYSKSWLLHPPLPEAAALHSAFVLDGLQHAASTRRSGTKEIVTAYQSGLITVITVAAAVIAFFFVGVYVPAVRAMDRTMKRTRSLLLLFPEQALMHIPSLAKALRSTAADATQVFGASMSSAHLGAGSRVRKAKSRRSTRIAPASATASD